LKSWLSLSLSKISCFLMEPEGSSPCSQKFATGTYPEPVESSSSHQPVSLRSFFHCLGRAKESVQVRGALKHFVKIKNYYGEVLSAPRPTPKLEDQPLSAVLDCLFNIFAATLRTRRTSLHPQPEDRHAVVTRDPPRRWKFKSYSSELLCQLVIW
jgi:hypothetical protein